MNPFEQLLTSSQGRGVSPEVLELAGRKAAADFVQKGIPLNDAIRAAVGDHPDFTNEHVKRVIEFANTIAFQEKFQGSEDKNVHFDVGDPGVILRDLKDGGSPAHAGKPMHSDYSLPPKQEKRTGFGDLDSGLQDMVNTNDFSGAQGQGEPIAKVASAHGVHKTAHANPVEDVYDYHVHLTRSRRELAGARDGQDMLLKQAQTEFAAAVRSELLSPDSAGLGSVAAALKKYAAADVVASVLSPVVEKLVLERAVQPEAFEDSLHKVAGVIVNERHPIISSFCAMLKTANDRVLTQEALDQMDLGLKQTTRFLRDVGRSPTAEPATRPIEPPLEHWEQGHGWD